MLVRRETHNGPSPFTCGVYHPRLPKSALNWVLNAVLTGIGLMHITDFLPRIVSGDMLKYSDDGSYVQKLHHWQVRWLRLSWFASERVVGWDAVEVAD